MSYFARVLSNISKFKFERQELLIRLPNMFRSFSVNGVPSETLVNLVIDIFKLSMSRQISLSGYPFGQKDFIQMAQVQISPDAAARLILTLVYQFWAYQF